MARDLDLTMEEEQEEKAGHAAVKKAQSGHRKPLKLKHKILLVVISLVLMGLLRTGFMFLIIGLLPSIVSYYIDISADRYMFKTILACNLCGMLPFIEKMLHHGPSNAVLQEVMGDFTNWFIIFGSALLGWLIVEVCPLIAQKLIVGFNQTQITRIERLQKKIEREWGSEVKELSETGEVDNL